MAFSSAEIRGGLMADLGDNSVSPAQAASQRRNVRRFMHPDRDRRRDRRQRYADPLTWSLSDKYPELNALKH